MKRLLLPIALVVVGGIIYASSTTSVANLIFDLSNTDGCSDLVSDSIVCDSICAIEEGIDSTAIEVSQPFAESCEFMDRTKILPHCREYKFSRQYALNDSSRTADFQIYVVQPTKMPRYIIDFVSKQIREKISDIFSQYGDDGKLIAPTIPLANSKTHTIEQMAELYYNHFCKLYKRECGEHLEPDGPVYGQSYSFQYCAVPVWQNSDSSLMTWKFYQFQYTGGAHGGSKEYFITFDNKTGRMLGLKDFFPNNGYNKALNELTRQLNAERCYDATDGITAELDDTEENDILSERIDGKIYPRPAIINDSLVFSYQNYQKGLPTCEQLHLTQPFAKNFKLRKKYHSNRK